MLYIIAQKSEKRRLIMADERQSSNLPTTDQIIAALDRTGFILEHRVYRTLRSLGFDSFLNDPFNDPETGKSREIDVVAIASRAIPSRGNTKLMIGAILMVECKNYADPLAIVGHDMGYSLQHAQPVMAFDPLAFKFASCDPDKHYSLDGKLKLWKRASHNTEGFIGTQLIRMHRQGGKWQATNDSVYDSIVFPLAKAVEAEEAAILEKNPDDQPWILPSINYCLPVLVTSGSIFAIDMTESEAPNVSLTPWAPLVRNFSNRSFMMDVVTYDAMEEYVKGRIFPLIDDVSKIVKSSLKLFDPVWLEKEYGGSADSDFNAWLEYFRSKNSHKNEREKKD
jgi:hypothetical protein